jgi:hypothetical protein
MRRESLAVHQMFEVVFRKEKTWEDCLYRAEQTYNCNRLQS